MDPTFYDLTLPLHTLFPRLSYYLVCIVTASPSSYSTHHLTATKHLLSDLDYLCFTVYAEIFALLFMLSLLLCSVLSLTWSPEQLNSLCSPRWCETHDSPVSASHMLGNRCVAPHWAIVIIQGLLLTVSELTQSVHIPFQSFHSYSIILRTKISPTLT
jgi:hypothetical protein